MAGWPKGQEVEMIQAGSDLWNNMTTDQVWKNWALSPVMGLTSKQGFLNNRPLLDFLKNMTDQFDRFYKRITVSALNFSTGQVEFFNQKNTPLEEFHKAAFASTCIPGAFPNYAWEQADGSTKYYSDNFMIGNINPDSAIKQCLELVDDESKITIDVLLLGNMRDFETYPEHTGGWFENKHHLKSYGNFMRSRQIKYQHSNSNSIVQWIRRRPNVNWRYIVQQENAVSGLDMLRFSADNTWPLQEEGRKVAYDILSNPTNYGKEAYLAWNSESFGQEEDSLL
uniref:PNPLA domain-containing protein n=1 Tax=Favella ehrenbergii TaxID=182087 RepID=A0A7S3MQN9_9SPIT|mmetsp:Transcript_9986/g.12525  ORF Transcript_9986/g.12525 Transcript_9986/m.12525 type:complete len:282 (+) Transcript_9986:238-1083(+)